jgi:hypothetical protein
MKELHRDETHRGLGQTTIRERVWPYMFRIIPFVILHSETYFLAKHISARRYDDVAKNRNAIVGMQTQAQNFCASCLRKSNLLAP